MDKLKSGLDKAQHEINDFTETTKLKMDVSKLQGQKKELFTQIGQEVYELHAKGQATPSEATCKQVDDLERQIKEKNEAIEKVHAAGTETTAPGKPAS
jgi:hypothetical protein